MGADGGGAVGGGPGGRHVGANRSGARVLPPPPVFLPSFDEGCEDGGLAGGWDAGQPVFEAEGGEGGAGGQGVGVLAGEGVEDGGAAPGGEAEVGGADAVGVAFGVLDVDVAVGAGDGRVEDEAEVFVDAGAFAAVAAHVGVESGEDAVEGAFAVAGGEDDGVGGEAGAAALLDVFEVEFDLRGGDSAAVRTRTPGVRTVSGQPPCRVRR